MNEDYVTLANIFQHDILILTISAWINKVFDLEIKVCETFSLAQERR